jgi:hypothetical protein
MNCSALRGTSAFFAVGGIGARNAGREFSPASNMEYAMIASATPRYGESRSHPLPPPPQSHRDTPSAVERHVESANRGSANGFTLALPDSLTGRIETIAPTDDGLRRFLDKLGRAVRTDEDEMTDTEAFAVGLALEPKPKRLISEPQVQALLADFRHRQRQANLLVTACVGSCFVLTVIGVATLASLADRNADSRASGASHSTSTAWQRPDGGAAKAAVTTAASLLMRQAMRLLEEGDITGARAVFQRASGRGNAKAAERSRTLASLSD